MKRALKVLAVLAVLALVVSAVVVHATRPAVADHVSEPTAPVLTFELTALRYGTEVFVDCTGVQPFSFQKVRLQPLISVAAAPSEHFDVTVATHIQVTSPKGITSWQPVPGGLQTTWAHQNVMPHDQNLSHHNVAYPSDMAQLVPGKVYRSTWTITTDVSQQVLVDDCIINVA